MRVPSLVVAVALSSVVALPAAARAQAVASPASWSGSVGVLADTSGTAALLPPLLSLMVPGAGQYRLGQSRAWGYALAEVVSWAVYLERRGAGARATRAYVDFAWSEARLQTGPRQDGEFAYYETMAHWLRSGAWDRDSGVAGVQPETDGTTYNGMLWNRAMALYGSDGVMGGAGYDEALRYYRERAISEGFLFDWSARPELQDVYVGLIHDSNQRYREATLVLGAVFLNHVVSAADAFVSSRVGRAGDPSHLSVSPDRAFPGRWVVAMTVPVGP